MKAFKWSACFETGIDLIDTQHKVLVDLVNQLGDLVASGDAVPPRELERVFHELADYAVYHFTNEETLMPAADAEHVARHRAEHATFLEDVGRIHAEGGLDDAESAGELLSYLTQWLVYHILGSDQDLARQLKAVAAGRDPQSAIAWRSEEQDAATFSLLEALDKLFHLVSQRNRELSELNRTLEQRVAQRTRDLEQANERLQYLAVTDALTGLPNRRHAMSRLELEWQVPGALSIMLIDADGFKRINDEHGHDAGDIVLRTLAQTLKDSVRSDDVVCRLGGDEFLVICPRTPLSGALQLAENMRRTVNQLAVAAGTGVWRGSISVGVARRDPNMESLEALIKVADEGVYRAKARGRNCVETVCALEDGVLSLGAPPRWLPQPASSAPTSTALPAGRGSLS